MTEEEVKAARERAAKATPGPWTFETFPNGLYEAVPGPSYDVSHGDPNDARDRYSVLEDLHAANAAFIAHARADVPALCDEVALLSSVVRDMADEGRGSRELEASRREVARLRAEAEAMKAVLLQTAEGTFGLWGDRARAVLDRLGVAYREPEAAGPRPDAMPPWQPLMTTRRYLADVLGYSEEEVDRFLQAAEATRAD